MRSHPRRRAIAPPTSLSRSPRLHARREVACRPSGAGGGRSAPPPAASRRNPGVPSLPLPARRRGPTPAPPSSRRREPQVVRRFVPPDLVLEEFSAGDDPPIGSQSPEGEKAGVAVVAQVE